MISPRTIALSLEYHLLKKERALLRGVVPAGLQSYLRRRARAKYLVWEARAYNAWMSERLIQRRLEYAAPIEAGLLSVVTPVWDGTPLKYLRVLAESIIAQNEDGHCEWVVVDNGCRKTELLAYLTALRKYRWVAVHEAGENAGIIGGLRLCLERAKGRYLLPVDSDDWLYPDCLRVVNRWLRKTGFAPLLYTDEDKLIGTRAVQPYFKPDFDPVLLLNSAYIAHLGVIDRELALKLGAYSDKSTEGSPDWDLFVRFLAAGHTAVHIPEVVYSWRMHPESTADDALSKPYIHASQKAVLQRYLNLRGMADDYAVEYSPLLNGTADWWLYRRQGQTWPTLKVLLGAAADYGDCLPLPVLDEMVGRQFAGTEGLVCLISKDLQIDRPDWLDDAMALMERHPDTVMVGGCIRNKNGSILSAGYVLGFDGDCGCPDRGRPAIDPGYFTQLRKQRSVSAVSTELAVIRASFLRELVASGVPSLASVPFLGAWAGAYALRTGKRVVYSPFMSGVSGLDWDALIKPQEREAFRNANGDIFPDRRFYPGSFGLTTEEAYRLIPP
ncbi:MAG TPA: glycosyltransferase [Bryobacteraceae bacterium]